MELPLCKECTQKQLKKLESQMAESIKENSSYKVFLNKLRVEKEKYPTDEQLDIDILNVLLSVFLLLIDSFYRVKKKRTFFKSTIEANRTREKSITRRNEAFG